MGWTSATDGYEVSLVAGKIVARKNGAALKALPKQLKDHDAVVGLRQLAEWLGRHDAECRRTVDDWLIRSLSVPASVIVSLWPDDSWRAALSGLVVAPVSDDGWDDRRAGFLREVDADGRLGVTDLDGESRWWSPERVVIPHPVLLADVEDLREFAAELTISQRVLQLFREIWLKPSDDKALTLAAGQFAGARYEQLRHLTSRAASHGYAVRGGYVTVRLWDAGQLVDARVWVGADDPSARRHRSCAGSLWTSPPSGGGADR